MHAFFTGLGVTLGLIVAIGAQNAWVLSKAMRGEHPRVIAVVCFTLDATLISLGVVFLSQLQAWLPGLVPWLTWLAIGLLAWLAVQSFTRAWRGSTGLKAQGGEPERSAWRVAGQAMLISLINPHVYLDTMVLIGSIGAQQSRPVAFVVGASLGSVIWFTALTGLGARLSHWLTSPRHWRVFDSVIGVVMVAVAWSLVP